MSVVVGVVVGAVLFFAVASFFSKRATPARFHALTIGLAIATLGAGVTTADAVGGVTTRVGQGQLGIQTAAGTKATVTSSTTFVSLAGATTSFRVLGTTPVLAVATFSAESQCSGTTPGSGCSVRILVDQTEMKPDAGNDFGFDAVEAGGDGSYTGASMQRSVLVGPGTHTLTVQEATVGAGVSFALDDWHLSSTESQYAVPPTGPPTSVVGITPASVTGVTTRVGQQQVAIQTAAGTNATITSATAYVPLAGATTKFTVLGTTPVLAVATFSAESRCSGATPAGRCSVRILVDQTEMKPDAGNDFAFDAVEAGGDGASTGASMQRSLLVGPGTHTLTVQEATVGAGVSFALDDWHLSTTESQYAVPPTGPPTSVVGITPASVTGVTTSSAGGQQIGVQTAAATNTTVTNSSAFVALPDATTTFTVTGTAPQLLVATFSAESQCSGPTAGDGCSVRILVDGGEANPAVGSDYAFDAVEDGGNGYQTGASMQRSLLVDPGTHTVTVQESTAGTTVNLTLDDWHLTTTQFQYTGSSPPPPPPPLEIRQLSTGETDSCVLLSDTTVKCWGDNEHGQMGNGTTTDSQVPGLVPGLTSVKQIAAGGEHTCALLIDTTVKCWGYNSGGQLGNGTTVTSLVPVPVTNLTGVTSVQVGDRHSCALLTDHTVKCWGANSNGALGTGNILNASVPQTVIGLTGVATVSTGGYHTCAVMQTATMKCWGKNDDGQLGDGTFEARTRPVDVVNLGNISQGIASDAHSCAVISAEVRCWGYNASGELGDGTNVNSPVPVSGTGLTAVTAVTAGYLHTCALLADNTARCWGSNAYVQLGNDSFVDSLTPVSPTNLSDVATISAGNGHTCALLRTNHVLCWGNNHYGQLGANVVGRSTVPVPVVGL